ncbi:helix-turn-helix domain-containing protein [Mobiluncus curtisii]|uniref:helix-turn-helix domain-containing protein n=1 Tax=Mobiluncus curtisii TaxID=2051 RepID=UPI003C6CED24
MEETLQVLRGLMVERGYDQQRLADRLGMARVTLSRKLNGQTSFSYEEITELADVLGVSMAEIIRRAEERTQQ